MRYLLISLAVFMLLALPAFAYTTPPPVHNTVPITVDINAIMTFTLPPGSNLAFDVTPDCLVEVASPKQFLYPHICMNGNWAIYAGLTTGAGLSWDGMKLWWDCVGPALIPTYDPSHPENGLKIAGDGAGCFDPTDWGFQLRVPKLFQKGNYTGTLHLTLIDP